MATFPASLGAYFDDKIRALHAVIDPDQKERKLRQGLDHHSAVVPDEQSFLIDGTGERRLPLTQEIIDSIRAWAAGDAREAIVRVESPIDQAPELNWHSSWWQLSPRRRVPTHLVCLARTPSATEQVRLILKANHFFQLPAPAAPTLTVVGTPGAQTVEYLLVARDTHGATLPGPSTTLTTAPAVLGPVDYVTVSWAEVRYAATYDLYRVQGGVDQGLLINVSTTTHDDQGSGCVTPGTVANMVPQINTTETSLGTAARPFVAALGAHFGCKDIMGWGRDNLPDGFGGAPADWGAIFDRAERHSPLLLQEWRDFVNRVAGAGAAGGAKSAISIGTYDVETRYGPALLANLRRGGRYRWP